MTEAKAEATFTTAWQRTSENSAERLTLGLNCCLGDDNLMGI